MVILPLLVVIGRGLCSYSYCALHTFLSCVVFSASRNAIGEGAPERPLGGNAPLLSISSGESESINAIPFRCGFG